MSSRIGGDMAKVQLIPELSTTRPISQAVLGLGTQGFSTIKGIAACRLHPGESLDEKEEGDCNGKES